MYLQTWINYLTKNCNQKGDQTYSNLTNQGQKGHLKTNKRQSNGEMIVSNTDKSQHFTVSTPESYSAQGQVHTKSNKVITWKDFNQIQNEVGNHNIAISNIFGLGREHGEKEECRIRETMNQKVTTVAQMSLQQKDHKPTDKEGNPKTRGLMNAKTTANQRSLNLLSEMLTAYNSAENNHELLSTGDPPNLVPIL